MVTLAAEACTVVVVADRALPVAVPESEICAVEVLFRLLSPNVIVPVTAPLVVGANAIASTQVVPGAICPCAAQVVPLLLNVNCGLATIEENDNAALPMFWIVTLIGALVAPSAVEGKTIGVPVPTVSLRMRLLPLSEMYRFPLPSSSISPTRAMFACVAWMLSPLNGQGALSVPA